jgi:acyl carrier protein
MVRPPPDQDLVFAALVSLMRRVCQDRLDGLVPATRLADIGALDSLRTIEVVALLEEHFLVEVDTDLLGDLHTVGDMIAAIVRAAPRAG